MKKQKVYTIDSNKKNKIIKKALIYAILLSILIPILLLLFLYALFSIGPLFGFEVKSSISVKSQVDILILQLPAFIEYTLISLSIYWIIIRFVILILLAYLNAFIVIKKLTHFKEKKLYFFISSVVIYFILLFIANITLNIINT